MTVKTGKVTILASAPGVYPSLVVTDGDVTTDAKITISLAELDNESDSRRQMSFYAVPAAGSFTIYGTNPQLFENTDLFYFVDVDGSGISGVSGLSGFSGYSGANPGASGVSGATGASGVSGATGASGVSGATGASGVSGATGASGASGASGTSGATGASGVSGATGISGTSGFSGANPGASGYSGASGTSGFSGAVGAGITAQFINTAASAPNVGAETEGEIYYNTVTHKAYVWNGTTWTPLW